MPGRPSGHVVWLLAAVISPSVASPPPVAAPAPAPSARLRVSPAEVRAGSREGALAVPSDTLVGTWAGSLSAGGARLRILFHLERTDDGELTGTLDSPDQGATGIPLSRVLRRGDSVRVEVASIGGRFRGELAAAGDSLRGEWIQWGRRLPLAMGRSSEPVVPERPQEPEPPLPYGEAEVTVERPEVGIELAGTLTLPEAPGPHPAVLLLSGSGAQDRDATVYGHRPFLVLADRLTRHGVAVLRLDDRGVGGSGGRPGAATQEELAEDALAALDVLSGRGEVREDAVGLVGHSEGAWIAARAAAASPERVAFVVLLAAPGVPGDSLLHLQSSALLRAVGAGRGLIAAQRAVAGRIFEILGSEPDTARARSLLERAYAEVRDELSPEEARALERALGGEVEAVLGDQIRAANTPLFRSLLAFDPRPVYRRLEQPVLALLGERDLQVPPATNASALREALRAGERPEVTVRVMPGLNHLFQPAETGLPAEYGRIATTVAPEVLDAVTEWILRVAAPAEAPG